MNNEEIAATLKVKSSQIINREIAPKLAKVAALHDLLSKVLSSQPANLLEELSRGDIAEAVKGFPISFGETDFGPMIGGRCVIVWCDEEQIRAGEFIRVNWCGYVHYFEFRRRGGEISEQVMYSFTRVAGDVVDKIDKNRISCDDLDDCITKAIKVTDELLAKYEDLVIAIPVLVRAALAKQAERARDNDASVSEFLAKWAVPLDAEEE